MIAVKLLRLSSGEELLGEVTETDTHFTIKNPVQVIVTMPKTVDASGVPTPAIGFAPWMFTMYTTMKKDFPNGVPILKAHVLFSPGVPQQVEDEYNKLFAKVTVPKSSLIIPQ